MAVLSFKDRSLLGANSQIVWLSRVSLDDHKLKHADIGITDYRRIPDIIANGEVYRSHGKRYVLLRSGDMTYRAAIKINFAKKKKLVNNSIATSGVVDESTLKMKMYREIKDEP